MRYERFCIITIFLTGISCSRETPAPPAAPTQHPATTSVSAPVATSKPTAEPAARTGGSYKEAMLWLQSAPAFHFTVDEGGVHAEGDLTRRTIGAESVRIRANGEEWRATAGARGVAWELRKGNAWAAAPAPAYGNRIYQRVTLAFDPQKKEGEAQLVAAEGTANHYRFTNANTGEVHDVWVNAADSHVERMRIGNAFEMKIAIREK
jgi:hypothetical protein